MPTDPTPQQVLDTPMPPNDANAETIRGYLIELLTLVWDHERGFSGKRPFGNSSWQHELCDALAAGGYVEAVEQGWHGERVETCIRVRALVRSAIRAMNGATDA